jgi:hypothetical protein
MICKLRVGGNVRLIAPVSYIFDVDTILDGGTPSMVANSTLFVKSIKNLFVDVAFEKIRELRDCMYCTAFTRDPTSCLCSSEARTNPFEKLFAVRLTEKVFTLSLLFLE